MYRRSRRPTPNRSDRSRSADAVKVEGPCQPLGFSRTILPWHWEVVMQRKRVWGVRTKILALMWRVPLMGSTCSPSEPGCEFGEACGEPTEKVRSCINFCAPIYPEPVVGPAVLCALDQCDEETISQPDVWRCPNVDGQAYACVPSDATPDPHRIGVCRPSGGFLDRCDPGDSTSCKSGAVCLNAQCPEASERHRLGVPPDVSAYCWFPVKEGEPCDSNEGRGSVGCRPCEWGTWCMETAKYGSLCVRSCSDGKSPESPRPELCACSAAAEGCLEWDQQGLLNEPPANDPQLFCGIRTIPNGGRCVPNGVPCEDQPRSQCRDGVNPLTGSDAYVCCRADGDTCSSAADCCLGQSVCFEGNCAACGADGEQPTKVGCCAGTVVVDGICRSCASSVEGQLQRSGGASCLGEFVQTVSSQATDTIAVPTQGNTGAGVSELPTTSGVIEKVRYQLTDEHRLFLLEGDLTGSWTREPCAHPPSYFPVAGGECAAGTPYPAAGVTVGNSWLQLPANAPGGGPRSVGLHEPGILQGNWQSVRVYDSGLCSMFNTWSEVGDAAVAGVNSGLVDVSHSSALRLDDTALTPILSSGSGPFGRAIEQDQLNIFFEYTAVDGAAGCGSETLIRFHAGLRLHQREAALLTAAGQRYERTMMNESWEPCFSAPPPHAIGDCMETCTGRNRDMFDCYQQYTVLDENGDEVPETRPVHYYAGHYDGVRYARDAFDFVPEIVYVDGGGVDCHWLHVSPTLRGQIQSQVERVVPTMISEFTGRLSKNALDIGVPWDDLVDCGELDGSGRLVPNHGICADTPAPLFGGRRHRCRAFDDMRQRVNNDAATQYRCEGLRIEIRRINIRPDGLEFVLVDGPDDPQRPLVESHFADHCAVNRDGTLPEYAEPKDGTIDRIVGLGGGFGHPIYRVICNSGTATLGTFGDRVDGCTGLCGDMGMRCTDSRRSVTEDGIVPGPQVQCYVSKAGAESHPVSQCCNRSAPAFDPGDPGKRRMTMCPWPESSGGRRLLNLDSSPSSGDYWSCRDLSRDPLACGACGVGCGGGTSCCHSACVDVQTDAAHCGRCARPCAAGQACVAGVCE